MITKILQNLPFELNADELAQRLSVPDALREEFDDIFAEALAVANPKVIYTIAPVEITGEREVRVGDITFVSKVLAVNMENVKTAFPYVATGGRELHDLYQSKSDDLEKFWVNTIAERALGAGLANGLQKIREDEATGQLYAMNPGSLPDWPISQQRPLFHLLGDVMAQIGVELTESFLMMPIKSTSGLLFEAKEHYTNCSLCPRENCPGRRDPFDEALVREKYGLDEKADTVFNHLEW